MVVVVSFAGAVTWTSACTPEPPAAPAAAPRVAPTVSAETSSPAATPADVAGRKAINAYLGMWHTMAGAAQTSDWTSPRLSEYATGQALNTISRGLYTDRRKGLVTKGAPTNAPTVSRVDSSSAPTRVMISDCGDSTRWVKYRADTGQRAEDGPGGRRSITATVDRQADGRWLVSDFAVRAVGTC